MKKLSIFLGLVLGFLFFTQCNKTTGVENYSNDNLVTRSESALSNAKVNNTIDINDVE